MSTLFDCQAFFTGSKAGFTGRVISSRQMDLAGFVKSRRQELGLSLRELGKRSGLSHAYIGYVEAGESPKTGKPISVTVDALEKLAKGLRVDANVLIKLARSEAQPVSTESLEGAGFTPRAVELAEKINSLPEEARRDLLAYLEFRLSQLEQGK